MDQTLAERKLTKAEEKPRLVRNSLHDEVVQLIRDMIIDGTLKPGQKIPERDLCDSIGISRTPLREALKVLASEGLIQLLPRKGAVVALLTDVEVNELFPILGAIEALAAETACCIIADAGIATIRSMHDKMIAAFKRRDWLKYANLNRSIHDAIFAAAGNQELIALYRQLTVRIRSRRYQHQEDPRLWQESVDDHEKIIRALEDRNGPEIAGLMKRHLDHRADAVRQSIKAQT